MEALERNRVFSVNELQELKQNTGRLMEKAIDLTGSFNRNMEKVRALAGRVPSEAGSNVLRITLASYPARFEKAPYEEFGYRADHLLGNILSNIPEKDMETAKTLQDIMERITVAGVTAEDLKAFLRTDTLDLPVQEYRELIAKLFPQNKVADEDIKIQQVIYKLGFVKGCSYTNDPVNVATGNFLFEESDIRVRGVLFLEVKRFYNSLNKKKGIFGRGWTSNLDIHLEEDVDKITIQKADGSVTVFSVDAKGCYRAAKHTEKLSKLENGYLYQSGRIHIVFENDGRPKRIEDKWNRGISYQYDEEKKLTEMVSDTGKKLTFIYEAGMLTSVRDNSGREIQYKYQKAKLCAVTNPMNQTRYYEYGTSNRIEKVIDESGKISIQNEYDKYHRVAKQITADGEEISYAYPKNKSYTQITYQDGHVCRYYYDDNFKTTITTDENSREIVETAGYQQDDLQKKLYQKSTVICDKKGNIIRLKRGNKWDEIEYGENGCPKKIRMSEGCEFSFVYDEYNRVIKKIDGNGHAKLYEYDACDRLIGITYPNGSSDKYVYDVAGNIIWMDLHTGKRYEMKYDAANRLQELLEDKERRTIFHYDKMGNICGIDADDNNKTPFTDTEKALYLTRRISAVQEHYDLAGNVTNQILQDGRCYNYQYDEMNRIVSLTENEHNQYTFQYDEKGNCIQRTDPLGRITYYQYDRFGNVSEITDAAGNAFKVTSAEDNEEHKLSNRPAFYLLDSKDISDTGVVNRKDECGRLIAREYGNGIRSEFVYETGAQIESIRHYKGKELLEEFVYAYDKAGNCIRIDKARKDCPIDSGRYEYAYDELDRLKVVRKDGRLQSEYFYDAAGNRTEKRYEETSFKYLYDEEKQLCYTEDVQKAHPEEDISISCRRQSAADKEYIIHKESGDYRVIYHGLPEAVICGQEKKYLLTDHLGSVMRVVAEDGETEQICSYDEFGNAIGEVPVYAGYAGYISAGKDVYALETRYYQPSTGRFLSKDNWAGSAGNPQTWNRFSYALNNPLKYRDASGRAPEPAMSDYLAAAENQAESLSAAGRDFMGNCARKALASGSKAMDDFRTVNRELSMVLLQNCLGDITGSRIREMIREGKISAIGFHQPKLRFLSYEYDLLAEGLDIEQTMYDLGGKCYLSDDVSYINDMEITPIDEIIRGVRLSRGGLMDHSIDLILEALTELKESGTGYVTIAKRAGNGEVNPTEMPELGNLDDYRLVSIQMEDHDPEEHIDEWEQIDSYWNTEDITYFESYWWQDEEKLREAYEMLKLEASITGGIDVFEEAINRVDDPSDKIYAIQAMFNATRTGYWDMNLLNQLEIVLGKHGKDIHEMDLVLDEAALDDGWEEYENILFKESGNFLERNGYIADGINALALAGIVSVSSFNSSRPEFKWKKGKTKGKTNTHALDNANYAQKTYSNNFSAEGRKIYSDLAGEPINTVDDLVKAINTGKVKVNDLPVEYIVRDGNTLIMNTRTSQALTKAGIPRSQWNAVNRTGNELFEELLNGQLSRNKLTSEGIVTVRPSGGQ